MSTLASPPLFDVALTPERERSQAAKTEQRKEEAPEQCSARTGVDDAAMRRFAAACSDGGRLTLEQRLDRVWEGLSAAGAAACPLCGGRMERRGESAARCSGCGSALT